MESVISGQHCGYAGRADHHRIQALLDPGIAKNGGTAAGIILDTSEKHSFSANRAAKPRRAKLLPALSVKHYSVVKEHFRALMDATRINGRCD